MSFKRLQISGYGDDLMVNNIKIGDLTPSDHEKIDKKHRPSISSDSTNLDIPSSEGLRQINVDESFTWDTTTFSNGL